MNTWKQPDGTWAKFCAYNKFYNQDEKNHLRKVKYQNFFFGGGGHQMNKINLCSELSHYCYTENLWWPIKKAVLMLVSYTITKITVITHNYHTNFKSKNKNLKLRKYIRQVGEIIASTLKNNKKIVTISFVFLKNWVV